MSKSTGSTPDYTKDLGEAFNAAKKRAVRGLRNNLAAQHMAFIAAGLGSLLVMPNTMQDNIQATQHTLAARVEKPATSQNAQRPDIKFEVPGYNKKLES
jgi:hypothetical protein